MEWLGWVEEHDGVAAWVQGVLSAIAILVGYWIGRRAERNRESEQRLEKQARARGIALAIMETVERWGGDLHVTLEAVKSRDADRIRECLSYGAVCAPRDISGRIEELHELADAAKPMQDLIYWARQAWIAESDAVAAIDKDASLSLEQREHHLATFEAVLARVAEDALRAITVMRASFGR